MEDVVEMCSSEIISIHSKFLSDIVSPCEELYIIFFLNLDFYSFFMYYIIVLCFYKNSIMIFSCPWSLELGPQGLQYFLN